jgi:hypothetical protein
VRVWARTHDFGLGLQAASCEDDNEPSCSAMTRYFMTRIVTISFLRNTLQHRVGLHFFSVSRSTAWPVAPAVLLSNICVGFGTELPEKIPRKSVNMGPNCLFFVQRTFLISGQ